jgi:hypothetical protein
MQKIDAGNQSATVLADLVAAGSSLAHFLMQTKSKQKAETNEG